jgi:hypothetical protein
MLFFLLARQAQIALKLGRIAAAQDERVGHERHTQACISLAAIGMDLPGPNTSEVDFYILGCGAECAKCVHASVAWPETSFARFVLTERAHRDFAVVVACPAFRNTLGVQGRHISRLLGMCLVFAGLH